MPALAKARHVAAIGLAALAIGCASSGSQPPEDVDCRALLSAGDAPLPQADGTWSGSVANGAASTTLELRLVDGRAYASLPEREQFDDPVRAMSSANGRTLCLAAPYRPASGVIMLQRTGPDWAGVWWDADIEADIFLSPARLPRLPRERALDFTSADGARLAGTLVLPAAGDGPFPVVVWVHGSSPTTRDTWFYRGRAYRLARTGVASLIWDKRGAGASTGEQPWNIDRLTLDAQAAIDAARAAPETADDRVVIAGASQGGWIAPRVAAENPWLAGVMVSAAPGITIAEQNLYGFERALQNEGVPDDLIADAVGVVRMTYEYYRTGEGYDALRARFAAAENQAFVNEPFFRRYLFQGGELPGPDVDPQDWRFMFVDYLEYWRRLEPPALAMWGADDDEVPAGLSRDRIATALASRGARDDVLVIFDDATHSLYVDRDEGDAWDWERTAPGYRDTVDDWLSRWR